MKKAQIASDSQPVRVVLYTRVSSDNQIRSGEGSLETQADLLQRAVELRADQKGQPHRVVALLREEAKSGKNMDRPMLRKLRAMVDDDTVDLVMVTKVDRISRSLLDFFTLHEAFEKHGVKFYSLNETFDTSTGLGLAMLQLVLVFAQLERRQTSDRTKEAMRSRAERGLWNGGHPILGYDHVGEGKLVVNEAEAVVVRAAFDQMLELRSARKVACWLNDRGHRQKRYTSRRLGDVGEREFSPAVVTYTLQNRHFLGEVSHSDEWFQGRHTGIVDPEVFARVQGMVRKNKKKGSPSTPASEHFYLLTGKLRCGPCGDYSMTTSSSRGQQGVVYPYYRCVSTTKKASPKCKVGLIRAETLESAVFEVVREAAKNPTLIKAAIEETERILREEMAPSRERLDALQAERHSAKAELDRGFAAMTSGALDDVGYFGERMREMDRRLAQLDAAIAEEEARLAEAEGRELNLDLAVQALQGFDTAFEYLTDSERKEFLDLMLDEVVVFPDHIEVALYEGSEASVALEKAANKAKGKKKATEPGGGQNDQTPVDGRAGEQGFVSCVTWLRRRDSNSRPGG